MATLKRTQQNFIVRIGKSEAEVTNRKRRRSCIVPSLSDGHSHAASLL